jgi:hypothetical protein
MIKIQKLLVARIFSFLSSVPNNLKIGKFF